MAICLRSNAENDSTPQTELMIDHQVGGRQHGSGGSLHESKGIAPTENCRAGVCCRSTRLANQNLKQFAERLHRQNDRGLRQLACLPCNSRAMLFIPAPLTPSA